MADVELLLRQYGEDFDERCPSVTDDEIVARADGPTISPGPHRSRWRVVAAAVALLVVGAIAVFATRADDGADVKVDQPPTPLDSTPPPDLPAPLDSTPPDAADGQSSVVVGPDTWAVAARISPEHLQDLIAATSDGDLIGSMDDVAAMIRDNSDAIEVLVVDDDNSSWTAAMGEDGVRFGCDPRCVPGLVVWTAGFDDEGSETVAHWLLSNWAIGLPHGDVMLSPAVEAEALAVADKRVEQVREQLGTYLAAIRQPSPDPRFDTAQLGSEQLVEAAPSASPPPEDVFGDGFPIPPEQSAWFATITTDNDILAYVVHLDIDAIVDPLGAIDHLVLPLLDTADPDGIPARVDFFVHRESPRLVSGRPASVELFQNPADPVDGQDGYHLEAGGRWDDGVATVALGGLPARVAVVATELPDGTPVWQRPVQGIVIFTAPVPEIDESDPSEWEWREQFVLYDADGTEILRYDADGNQI